MRRSKMEMYIDILKVMAHNGPMKLTHIMYRANVNCNVLKENLDFLIQQNLIEEQITVKRKTRKVRFIITEKARTVLRYFNEVDKALQITGEKQIPALIY